jgi:hypothetical protein
MVAVVTGTVALFTIVTTCAVPPVAKAVRPIVRIVFDNMMLGMGRTTRSIVEGSLRTMKRIRVKIVRTE